MIMGMILLGVYFGVHFLYDGINLEASTKEFVAVLLQAILIIGILLLVSGVVYKVVKLKLLK